MPTPSKSAKQAKFLQDMAAPAAAPAASTGAEGEMPELDPAAVDAMTATPTASEPSMLDLSQASDEELEAELARRKSLTAGNKPAQTRIPMMPPSKTEAIPPTETLGSY